MQTNITVDNLTKDSVSVLWQDFDDSSEDLVQVGDNRRKAYLNSDSGRAALAEEVPEPYLSIILEEWGATPTIEMPTKSIEEVREETRTKIKNQCHDKIVSGIDFDCGLLNDDGTSRGSLHYSLSEKNQTDMRDLAMMISSGQQAVTWRDDSRVSHEVYTAQQFLALYAAATQYILQCRFHSDALETMLDRCETIDEINSINWESEIPDDIQSHIDELWATMYPSK